jgi:putative SOS response-associated peptidase YedK
MHRAHAARGDALDQSKATGEDCPRLASGLHLSQHTRWRFAVCGRFTLTIPTYEDLASSLGVEAVPGGAELYRPRYNIAPTDPAWVVRIGPERTRELALLEWGLVPRWSKTLMQAGRPINARAESIASRPVFKDSLARRRCLVVSDGFYEWDKSGPVKQPLWFRPAGGGILFLGGIWDSWRGEDGVRRQTFAIVTTAPSHDVERVHDRMLRPAPDGSLVPTPVSTRVGNVKNDDPSVLVPDPIPGGSIADVGHTLSLFDAPIAAGSRRKH